MPRGPSRSLLRRAARSAGVSGRAAASAAARSTWGQKWEGLQMEMLKRMEVDPEPAPHLPGCHGNPQTTLQKEDTNKPLSHPFSAASASSASAAGFGGPSSSGTSSQSNMALRPPRRGAEGRALVARLASVEQLEIKAGGQGQGQAGCSGCWVMG